MSTAMCEKVVFPVSAYVWCKGTCAKLGQHPIFVSSPVSFERDGNQRFTILTCKQLTCSTFGKPIRYAEKELGFQDDETATNLRTKCG